MTSPFFSDKFLRGEHLFWAEEKWRALQTERLAEHVRHAATSRFYQGKGIATVRAGELTGENLGDFLRGLPMVSKQDLAAAGEEAFAGAVGGANGVREWVTTSGSAGKPLRVPMTGRDLERLAANEAVALGVAGVTKESTVALAVGMDRMFVAGLAYWLGAQAIGAACVRVGPQAVGTAESLREMLETYRPTHLITVPSFLTGWEEPKARVEAGTLKGVIAIGEPIRGMKEPMQAAMGMTPAVAEFVTLNITGCRVRMRFSGEVAVMSTYACTETCTTFAEGPMCLGGHLNPELACVELLNGKGEEVGEWEVGELVITPMGVEGMPLLRFKTGDMAMIYRGLCECGRTTPRVGPILGRKHQLLKLRGVSVFPAMIWEALSKAPEVLDYAVIVESDEALLDRLTVCVALRTAETTSIREAIEGRLRSLLRVVPAVRVMELRELRLLQNSTGVRKGTKFVDRRGG